MKTIVWCVLLLMLLTDGYAQLVRKKDYDAAFALQAGGETGILTSFRDMKMAVTPVGGLKMTFPFSRKWFLGSEVNYSRLKYSFSDEIAASQGADFDIKQLQVPVYLKYMLNSNRASVLFGFYGTYVLDATLHSSMSGTETASDAGVLNQNGILDYSPMMDTWNAGITIGYELRIIKHMNVMCRVSGGMKNVLKSQDMFGKKLYPIQATITLSYDIFRIGDCGCD